MRFIDIIVSPQNLYGALQSGLPGGWYKSQAAAARRHENSEFSELVWKDRPTSHSSITQVLIDLSKISTT